MRQRDDRGERALRARFFLLAVGVVLAVLLLRLLHLQVIQAERLKEVSDSNRLRIEHIPALRGRILDRAGRVLADNRPSFWVSLDPLVPEYAQSREKLDRTIRALAVLLGEDGDWLARKVKDGRFSAPLGVRLKGGLSEVEVAAIEERMGELPGVRIEARPLRCYPHGPLAAHLLGSVGEVTAEDIRDESELVYKAGDFAGRGGVEEQFEGHLRGKDGRKRTQVDALGRQVHFLGGQEKVPAKPGKDLDLALDVELQQYVERELASFRSGAVVVIEMESGGILAMASKPSFDPNAFARGLSLKEWKTLESDELCPLVNRSTQAAYPPGSTFKLVTAVAALEEGVISPEDRPVNCTGSYVLGNRRYGCWKETGHGRLDMVQAIAQSCSCYFYHLGRLLGVERLSLWAKRLGLPLATGVDLPVEKRGLVPDPAWYDEAYGKGKWTQGLALNLAIGQGELLATPLKLATLAMAVGGSGRWPKPHVLKGVAAVSWEGWEVPQQTLDVVRRGMLEAVQGEKGSGRLAAVDGVAVAGKTGTAQNPHGENHSAFIGFAPYPSPSVAICVYLENAGHGGEKAAPLAGKVLGFHFGRLGVEVSAVAGAAGPVGGSR